MTTKKREQKNKNGGKRAGAGAPPGNQNAAGHKGVGVSLFKPEYVDKLIGFFDIEPIKQEVYETTKEWYKGGKGDNDVDGIKKISQKIRYVPNRLPTLFRFSRLIGVSYVTVNNWYKQGKETIEEDGPDKGNLKHPELEAYSEAYDAAKEMQKEFLITLGLSGATPPTSYVFTAKNITDMRDRIENDLTSKGDKLGVVYLPQKAPLPTEETR